MSLNIQTSTGLLEIGGKVTEEKVISALGYVPANETHVEDTNAHVSSEDREFWNNKDYNLLENTPNIVDDGSNNLVISDPYNNIIMKVDADGVTTTNVNTTNVNTKVVTLNGEDLGSRLDGLESISLPNILDNGSDNLMIADPDGNAIVKIDAAGLETTTATAKSFIIKNEIGETTNVVIKLDEHAQSIDDVSKDLSRHLSDTNNHIISDERTLWNENVENFEEHKEDQDVHIRDGERTTWNNKSDFSGDFNDLTNNPITEDNSGELKYCDESGNIIAKIGADGFTTTDITAMTAVIGGADVTDKFDKLSQHIENKTMHITSAERAKWEAKATTAYVDEKIAQLVNSAPETLDTLDELAAALGDDENFATTVTNQIGLKVDQTLFESHTGDDINHIKETERTAWNAKVDESYVENSLENLKEELSTNIVSNSKEFIIVDEGTNIIAKIDEDGLATTTVTAQSVVANGVDLAPALEQLTETVSKKADTSSLTSHTGNKSNPHGVTCDQIGAQPAGNYAAASHGNHVPATQTANNAVFLRNDNTWQTVTPANIGAATANHTHPDIASSHNHDDRYYTETEVNNLLNGKANSSHGNHVPATQTANNAVFLRNDNTWATVTPANIGAQPAGNYQPAGSYASSNHTHDDRYYTESEVNNLLSGKANSSHGNHVPTVESANNARFLRNDNTWQTITPANIGAQPAGSYVDLSSNQTIGGNKVFTGTTSTMVLHTYNPLYINNGTDNAKNTSLYTNDSNVFAITSSANNMTFNGKSVAFESYTPSYIKIVKEQGESSYDDGYNEFAPFNSSKTIVVKMKQGNLDSINTDFTPSQRALSLYGITIGANIHTVRVNASVRYHNNDSSGCNLHTYLIYRNSSGSSVSWSAVCSNYIHGEGYQTHNIDTIVNVEQGGQLFLYSYKGTASRNIDVDGMDGTGNNYECTQMCVEAIG